MARGHTWDSRSTLSRHASADDLLDRLGLIRKSDQIDWLWPALGGVAVGLVSGLALGMALAPRKGTELRREIAERLKTREKAAVAAGSRMAGEARGSQDRTTPI